MLTESDINALANQITGLLTATLEPRLKAIEDQLSIQRQIISLLPDNVFEEMHPLLQQIQDDLTHVKILSEKRLEVIQSRPKVVQGVDDTLGSDPTSQACKDCGRPIVFLTTAKGKSIPCDPGVGVVRNAQYKSGQHRCHLDSCPKSISKEKTG